jgi:hypothetical protein
MLFLIPQQTSLLNIKAANTINSTPTQPAHIVTQSRRKRGFEEGIRSAKDYNKWVRSSRW